MLQNEKEKSKILSRSFIKMEYIIMIKEVSFF